MVITRGVFESCAATWCSQQLGHVLKRPSSSGFSMILKDILNDPLPSSDHVWVFQMIETLTCCCLGRRGVKPKTNFVASANFCTLNLDSG